MISCKYADIFSNFFLKAPAQDLLALSDADLKEFLIGFLHSSTVMTPTRRIFSSISLNDETETLSFTLKNTVDDESDLEFVQDVLGQGMKIAWLNPRLVSAENIAQMYGGKEEKFYSQANHINALLSLKNDTKKELKSIIKDYGYTNNPYIKGDV